MPMPITKDVLNKLNKADSKFNLDISGVAGFFGGDVAVSAMGTIHLYRGRRWLGWYNSPGSLEIAKCYGVLGRSRLWDGLYPGVNIDPARLFGLDDKEGPSYRGVRSGTRLEKTGHISYLLLQECDELAPSHTILGRRDRPSATVTVVDLRSAVEDHNIQPAVEDVLTTVLALLPILVTLAASVLSALIAEDWYCFGLILFGALVSGASCVVIGSAGLELDSPKAAVDSPPGDGLLGEGSSNFVIIRGPEDVTNIITKGRFKLCFSDEPKYHMVGCCALFLTVQFLAQLLIIPVGTIFGQLMFLASLAASWMYTTYLSSKDRESLQRTIVIEKILRKPSMVKYAFGTRTMAAAFALRVLRNSFEGGQLSELQSNALRKQLRKIIPNETPVWIAWRGAVYSRCAVDGRREASDVDQKDSLPLLKTLLDDAETGLQLYEQVQGNLNDRWG